MPITPTGFQIETYTQIREQIKTGVQSNLGTGFEMNEGTFEGDMLSLVADGLSELNQLTESVVNIILNPLIAEDAMLTMVAKNLYGLTRLVDETDVALTQRIVQSRSTPSILNFDTMIQAILDVSNVNSVEISHNFSDVSINGLAPDSISVSIDATLSAQDAQDVAQAIYENKPVGLTLLGTTTIKYDNSGNCYPVLYSPTTNSTFDVTLTFNPFSRSCFSLFSDVGVEQTMVDYFNAKPAGSTLDEFEIVKYLNLLGADLVEVNIEGSTGTPSTDTTLWVSGVLQLALGEKPLLTTANVITR